VDIFCGQEHNLEPDQTQVRKILHDETAQQHWRKTRVLFGTTAISFTNMYKSGGTYILSTGNITGRIIHQESDKCRWWVSQTFRGHAQIKITVITAYQEVGEPVNCGCITTASQQQSLLLQSQVVTSNQRTAFRRDLLTYLELQQLKGKEILLVGDFNEPFGSYLEGMEKIATEIQLLDFMSIRHSSRPPAAYARGHTRLHYALSTATHVAAALNRSGYEPFNERFHTDHKAYFLDFNTARLFSAPTQKLDKAPQKILKSKNISQVTLYLKLKYDMLLAHNVFERAALLCRSGERHAFAECLDKYIIAASLAAEARLKPVGQPAWSVALMNARQLVTILSKCNTMLRTGLDHQTQIQQ
jgi:hypothetical protein